MIKWHVKGFGLEEDDRRPVEVCSGATVWKPAVLKLGLYEDTTFRGLRRTFVSTALAQGVPVSEVSRWLGRRSVTTTIDLYGHLVPEARQPGKDALDNAFKGALGVR